MSAPNKFKLLSGALNGIEFTLADDDTVFSVGAQSELADGPLGTALARAENTFYLPSDSSASTFIIRVKDARDSVERDDGADVAFQLGLQNAAGEWEFKTIPANEVNQAYGLSFAVRRGDVAWSAAVLDFELPAISAVASGVVATPARRWHALRNVWLAVAGCLILGAGGYAVYRHYSPEVRVQGIATILQGAPAKFDVLHGNDGRIYAIADTSEALLWGMRAVKRMGKEVVFVERDVEIDRLTKLVSSTGNEVVVIRLRDPARPQVLLSSASSITDAKRNRAKAAVAAAAPYAESILVSEIGDAELIAVARAQLRAQGISTTVMERNGRVSVANDTYLDDARLNAMADYIVLFERQWGARRITIHMRLWDDLLKGRSYQYSQDQLMSVGRGRWQYSNDVGRN